MNFTKNKSEDIIKQSQEIIKKEQAKIKEEKLKIKKEKIRQKREKRSNSFFGKLLNKVAKYFDKKETYSNKEIFTITGFSVFFGLVFGILIITLIIGGGNLVTMVTDLKNFTQIYGEIINSYYGDIDKKELINSAIDGMLSSVDDDYTTYIDDADTESFLETIEGTYEGIGCTVSMNQNNQIIVISMFENSPAEKAGIQVGDIITKVDGEDYSTKTSEDVAAYIKGSAKSDVVVTVVRGETTKDITIKREAIEIPSVTKELYEKNDKKIGYINISTFSSLTKNQFEGALKELETEKIEGLVIDVRNNSGGYLTSVNDIADILLEKGSIIYQLEDSKGLTAKKSTSKTKRTYPIAVVVNGGSASASEIMASAIKESYGGFVVGTTTFGKGTVQQTHVLSDGSMLKYTVQKWLTPNGNWIDEKGVQPTHYVDLTEDYIKEPIPENDAQLQTALTLVTEAE